MRSSKTLGTVVGLLSAALVGGLLTAAPASALEPTVVTELVAGQQFHKAVYADGVGPKTRDRVGFAGGLSAGGEPIADATLILERQLTTEDVFVGVDELQTDEQGGAVFFTKAAGNASYRVTFAGDETNLPAESEPMTLKVMRDFNASKVTKGRRIWLKGDVNPGWGKRKVILQRKTCGSCNWKKVRQQRTTASGGFKLRAAYPPLHKKWRFRAKLKATEEFVASVSAVLRTRTVPARVTATGAGPRGAGRVGR